MVDDVDRRWATTMADAYEQYLTAPVFQPFAVDLAERVAAAAPRRVLELAAGTGALTRALAKSLPGAELTATDLNDAMVACGRERAPAAEWRQADALALPFGDGEFDAITCQFGVMFFPDKPAAFSEARRVLPREGTLVFNAWAALETHDFQAALVAALESVFPDDPPTFMAAVPHGYADPDVVAADLAAGGFAGVRADLVELVGEAASATDLAIGYCIGTPLRAGIEARGDLAASTRAVAEAMEDRLGPGPVSGRMSAYVFEATPS